MIALARERGSEPGACCWSAMIRACTGWRCGSRPRATRVPAALAAKFPTAGLALLAFVAGWAELRRRTGRAAGLLAAAGLRGGG